MWTITPLILFLFPSSYKCHHIIGACVLSVDLGCHSSTTRVLYLCRFVLVLVVVPICLCKREVVGLKCAAALHSWPLHSPESGSSSSSSRMWPSCSLFSFGLPCPRSLVSTAYSLFSAETSFITISFHVLPRSLANSTLKRIFFSQSFLSRDTEAVGPASSYPVGPDCRTLLRTLPPFRLTVRPHWMEPRGLPHPPPHPTRKAFHYAKMFLTVNTLLSHAALTYCFSLVFKCFYNVFSNLSKHLSSVYIHLKMY